MLCRPFFCRKRCAFLSAFFACALFVLGCGLDTFYYLEPPKNDGHSTRYDSVDETILYFSFLTNEEENSSFSGSDFDFRGTEVYYKIYSSSSAMESAQNAIDSLNSSSDVSAAATNLINTRYYKTLSFSETHSSPLVPSRNDDRYVYIRLNDMQGGDETQKAAVCIGNKKMTSYSPSEPGVQSLGAPRRSFNSAYGFNFNKNDSSNPPPKEGDEDVFWSGSSSPGVWYIDMWAVSAGRDGSYSSSYSKLLHLGSVRIEQKWYED